MWGVEGAEGAGRGSRGGRTHLTFGMTKLVKTKMKKKKIPYHFDFVQHFIFSKELLCRRHKRPIVSLVEWAKQKALNKFGHVKPQMRPSPLSPPPPPSTPSSPSPTHSPSPLPSPKSKTRVFAYSGKNGPRDESTNGQTDQRTDRRTNRRTDRHSYT